jgi:hypothetical protein
VNECATDANAALLTPAGGGGAAMRGHVGSDRTNGGAGMPRELYSFMTG